MSKILVTGAEGFIGSHLVELLIKKNYKVRAFCLYNSFNSHGWLDTLSKSTKNKIDFVIGDIRDINTIKTALKGCDTVIHLAALIAIPYSYIATNSYLDVNIQGTLNLLEVAKQMNLKKITHVSSSEVYGSAQFLPISEKHPINPQSPYAASKAAADHLVSAFHKSFNLPISIVRPFNTFGPRQSLRAVIPSIALQIINNSSVNIGSLGPKRDFTYVNDTVNGIIKIHESKITEGKVLNIGSGFSISIGEIIEVCSKIIGKKVKIIVDKKRIRPTNSEVDHLLCDNSQAKKFIKWKSQCKNKKGLESSLRQFIKWLNDKDNLNFYKNSFDYII